LIFVSLGKMRKKPDRALLEKPPKKWKNSRRWG
jgi:hypothetical protein